MVANNSTAFTRLHFKHDGIHKLTWHPWRPYLVCVAKRGALLTEEEGPANNTSSSVSPSDVPFTVTVLAFNNQQALMLPVWEAIVAIPGRFGTSKLISINHHFSHPWLLFIFERGLYLWDYQNTIGIANRVLLRAVAKNGGFFPVTNCAWTLPLSSSGSVDWGVWEYQHDTYHEYELERYDHYGRGAALHPSGLLIGALWNAYACGYLIHSVQEVADGVLGYYEQPTAKRTEYENYAPAFSPDGALF